MSRATFYTALLAVLGFVIFSIGLIGAAEELISLETGWRMVLIGGAVGTLFTMVLGYRLFRGYA